MTTNLIPGRVLTEVHREYLRAHSIADNVTDGAGIFSRGDDIVFPWTDDTDGLATEQRRTWPGGKGVYYWETGKPLHLWTLRDAGPDSVAYVVEGTKQGLAFLSNAPEGSSVYAMPGCWGWGGASTLSRFTGRRVVILLDADAASNRDVYDAGARFKGRLGQYTDDVWFATLADVGFGGSEGIDDALAKQPPAERAGFLAYVVSEKRLSAKPAANTPPPKAKGATDDGPPDVGDRVVVMLDDDKRELVEKISGALVEHAGGTVLFEFGGVVSRLKGGRTTPLDRDSFHAELIENVACFHKNESKAGVQYKSGWPDQQSVGAVLSKADRFPHLERVTPTPFLRPDGTLCSDHGYDESTRTFLTDGAVQVNVPSEPTQADAQQAAKFLMDEWLGDIPFETAADRANCLGLVLTPFIRGSVDLVPMAVINGLHMGVGKNLLAECVWTMARGQHADITPLPKNDDETRKTITSQFLKAPDAFVFDEAHTLEGNALALALTSRVYSDRVLGFSRMGHFPNRATWMAMGNQVQVNGDVSRRVYHIKLTPGDTTPYDRRDDKPYRHPDLLGWTRENRSELMTAALTILRAWQVAGRPAFSRGSAMGSFEQWDRLMSGTLAYAGLPDFLTDVQVRRSESDFSTAYWLSHVLWLADTFGLDTPFATSQVYAAALTAGRTYEGPPDLTDPKVEGYTRKLGQAYARKRNVPLQEGLMLKQGGTGHNNTKRWIVTRQNGGEGVTGGTSHPSSRDEKAVSSSAHEGAHATYRGRLDPPVTPIPPVPSGGYTGVHDTETQDHGHQEDPRSGFLAPVRADVRPGGHLPVGSSSEGRALVAGPASPGGAAGSQSHRGRPERVVPAVPVTGRVPLDLETGSADALYTREPGAGYIRLTGVGSTAHGTVESGAAYVTHNGHYFDLPALDRHAGVPVEQTIPLSRDLRVAAFQHDPPTTYETTPGPGFKSYSLDALGERYLGVPKSEAGKALAKEYGGWDNIPADDPRYAEYCVADLDLTRRLDAAIPEDPYEKREAAVSAVTARATLSGMRVDVTGLQERAQSLADQADAGRAMLAGTYGFPTTNKAGKVASAPQRTAEGKAAFEAALADLGYPVEYWPRGADGSLSLGKDVMAKAAEWARDREHPALSVIEAVQTMNGIRNNAANVLRWVGTDGRVHPLFSPFQSTGRWSVQDPGLTVLKKGVADSERAFLLPDEGHVLVSIDLDQVDIRCVAAHSQDENLLAILNDPERDIHQEVADLAGVARKEAKTLDLGWLYGRTVNGLAKTPGVDIETAERVDASMRDQFAQVMQWQSEVRAKGEAGVLLDNGFGRRLRVDPERAFTQAPALMGQSTTRDLIAEGLLDLARTAPEVLPMLRVIVHDEVVASVPREHAEEIARVIQSALSREWAPAGASRPVSITAGQGKPFVFGETWADLYL